MTGYAELQITSNFSFLRSGSHPEELALTAAALGHAAFAVTDRNSLAGVVRAHKAAQEAGIRFIVGCCLDLRDGRSLLCYPSDRAAYGRLSRLLTVGKTRAVKGECHLDYADVVAHGEGQLLVAVPPEDGRLDAGFRNFVTRLATDFPGRAYLAAQHLYRGDDAKRLKRLADLADAVRLPLLATNDVLYHVPERRVLQDVVTCIREGCTIAEAGFRLNAHAERHLKPEAEMRRLFRSHPDAVSRTVELAERCRFSLDELKYEYPDEFVPEGRTPQQLLVHLTWRGAAERFPVERYPEGVPPKVREQLEYELRLIEELAYAPYFLTVHDVVRFAREKEILCQGRGSAANSAVCYCLGITEVDPTRINLLFERFISAERNEPPDIDVDFEHERREEVIQYVYRKYGRDRAGIAATVICYRSRGAIREVGKVMGLSQDVTAALAGSVWGWSNDGIEEERVREAGLDPADPTLRLALELSRALIGFPRHLSQHVGGFVITRGPLAELVPIENAAMEDRTVIEWDKDDIDALHILKIDVLALGMLTCIRKAFDLIRRHYGRDLTLATVPAEEAPVYEMLSRADSIGVFQVESRAQMTMLPRLRPRNFYDLVIEVAIVRPGPIQGDMVHPYLRRRDGKEKVEYPSEELREVLEKTLGVPLFQEQAMRIAIVGAGFTPAESDRLRRAMATFRKAGIIHEFRTKMIEGMVDRGYKRDFATRCFQQIEGFGTYGFPESHAASFALLVYVSAWIKCHYPDVFAASLLNSQPMGFYAPAQIVRDAREHGVTVREVDVNASEWDCTLEETATDPAESPSPLVGEGRGEGLTAGRPEKNISLIEGTSVPLHPSPSHLRWAPPSPTRGEGDIYAEQNPTRHALRLGFRQIKGFSDKDAERLVAQRGPGYAEPRALWQRAGLSAGALEKLAQADAFRSLGLDRRQALWALKGLGAPPLPLFAAAAESPQQAVPETALPEMTLGEHVAEDYSSLRLSLKRHPLAFLRDELRGNGMVRAVELAELPVNRRVSLAGLVVTRQRPGTASGVIFVTLEDETGIANLIVWPAIFEAYRRIVLGASLIGCTGRLQREGLVIHVVAERLVDLTPRLRRLRDGPILALQQGRGDEAKHPPPQRPSLSPDLVISSRDFR
ncbi:MAG: error-prone DNA polymerase [Alphaproteobacteria bacterium]|nr:error-prone DNA polymerase [Alphaproteobacteria bacterium]